MEIRQASNDYKKVLEATNLAYSNKTKKAITLQKLGSHHFMGITISVLNKGRSSCPEMFSKKGVLRNFAKFTGKHLCQSPFFIKVAGLRQERLWHRCFPVNFAKFLRTAFITEHIWWLLLQR